MQHDTDVLCMTLSDLAKDRFDLAETAKHLAQKVSANRENSSISTEAWSTHGILSASPKLQYDSDDKNTLTKTHSSWTASSLAIQSRKKKNTTEFVSLGTTQ